MDDIICIRAGTYKVNQTLTYITPNGDGGHKLIIRGVAVQITRINTGSDKNERTSDEGGEVRVENITFRNGRIEEAKNEGGGLHITTSKANVVLTNNTFVGNVASYSGGA